MRINEYVDLAYRTAPGHAQITEAMERSTRNRIHQLQHAAMGMSTEVGEFWDALKRHIQYGTELDLINLGEEISDILWYIALAAKILEEETGYTLEDWMEKNIAKLQKRYPNAFSEQDALNRDLVVERKVLEGSSSVPIAGKEYDHIFKMTDNNLEEIARVESDGTVVVHKEGGDKEASKIFWKSMEFEGKTLYQQIEDLEKKNKELEEKLKNANR